MQADLLEWDVAARMRSGENVSGDLHLVCPSPRGILVAVVDGIGHGPEAASASRKAVSILEANAGRHLEALFGICHAALQDTRGVVMSLADFEIPGNRMAWLGVGNVEGRLLHAGKGSERSMDQTLLLRGGVVGHMLPTMLDVSVLPVAPGDVLILTTDGIHHRFIEDLQTARPAARIASDILARYSKGTDDALVLVAKVRGGEPSQGP